MTYQKQPNTELPAKPTETWLDWIMVLGCAAALLFFGIGNAVVTSRMPPLP